MEQKSRHETEPKSERGIVKWFDEEKNYGFIRSEAGNKEYFVHSADIQNLGRSLRKGEHVEFDIAKTDRGPKAANVRLIDAK